MEFDTLYPRFQDPEQRKLLSKDEIAFVQAECRNKARTFSMNGAARYRSTLRRMKPAAQIAKK